VADARYPTYNRSNGRKKARRGFPPGHTS
jgi:hypothetical protein